MVEHLRTSDEARALDLLRILRAYDDPATVLSVFKNGREGDLPRPIPSPDHGAALASRPSLESELMSKNPMAYPALCPVLPSVLAGSDLLRPLRESVSGKEE